MTEDESVWGEDRVKKEALEKCASDACVRSCALRIEVGAVAGLVLSKQLGEAMNPIEHIGPTNFDEGVDVMLGEGLCTPRGGAAGGIEYVRKGAIVARNCEVIGADVDTDEQLVFPLGPCEDANGAVGTDARCVVGSSVCRFTPFPVVDVTVLETVWSEGRVKKEALVKENWGLRPCRRIGRRGTCECGVLCCFSQGRSG